VYHDQEAWPRREWYRALEKMKMRRLHRVPLSKQALEIIRNLQAFGRDGRWLFPSVRSIFRQMCENTLNAALRRLGYNKRQMTAHNFKGMASTRLNEMGCWNPDAIERQLAHRSGRCSSCLHAPAEYWPERVKMMQAWADYLDELERRW
jgi:integrase